ncbi:MAG: GDSL-type esterase/lipase family protein [Lachnospiraceae bacterium]|nr:GDSL-type esterase/lipase family protein [Lachnospiraceae bacterium]
MKNIKIICLGDSLTYGFGISRSDIWTSLSAKKTGLEIINKGINGDTTGGMLARFNEDVVSQNPDIAFIMGGGNDIIMDCPLGVVRSNITAMVHQSYAAGFVPVLGIPINFDWENIREDWGALNDFKRLSKVYTEYFAWLKKYCGVFNVAHIDFNIYNDEMSKKGISSQYLDGLHPTAEGHALLSDIFALELSRILKL